MSVSSLILDFAFLDQRVLVRMKTLGKTGFPKEKEAIEIGKKSHNTFNAPHQYISLHNLRPLISNLTPFGRLHSLMLAHYLLR